MTITVAAKGKTVQATVDPECFEALNRYKWRLDRDGYVVRSTRVRGRCRTVSMHRVVMGCRHGDGREIDHESRNKLDNRRGNLREATRVQQMQNVGANRGAKSAHRGVSWRKDVRRWIAFATINGKRTHLGFFDDEDEAGAAAAHFRQAHGYA